MGGEADEMTRMVAETKKERYRELQIPHRFSIMFYFFFFLLLPIAVSLLSSCVFSRFPSAFLFCFGVSGVVYVGCSSFMSFLP